MDHLERGYHNTDVEYDSLDLAVRDTLSQALDDLRPSDRHWLLRRLIPIDRRFTAATEEDDDLRRPRGRRRRCWWRGRVPSRRVHLSRRDPHSDPTTDFVWPLSGRQWVPMRPVSLVWPDPDGHTSGWWSSGKT